MSHGVAESEEQRADEGEHEEDAEDGRRAEGDLAVGAIGIGAALGVSSVGEIVVIIRTVCAHPLGSVSGLDAGAMAGLLKVWLKRFISSMGSGKTMVVFFSTPISVRVWR